MEPMGNLKGWFQIVDRPFDIAPDNRTVCFAHVASRDLPSGIYLRDTSTTALPKRILDFSYGFSDARFSPDGQRLAYVRNYHEDVFVLDLRSGVETRVTHTYGNAEQLDWDPSGKRIVYMRVFRYWNTPDSSAGLHIVDLASGTDLALRHAGIPTWGGHPRWSPDGESIAFSLGTHLSESAKSPAPFHIYCQTIDGSKYKDLTPGDPRTNDYLNWMPIGHSIIFQSFDYYSGKRSDRTDIIDADGSNRNTLSLNLALGPSVLARDASYLVFFDSDPLYPDRAVLFSQAPSDTRGRTRKQLTHYLPTESGSTSAYP